MSDIYSEMQGVAQGLLKEFKQGVIQYVQITPGTGPADDPGPSTRALIPLDGTVIGAPFKYIKGGFNGLSNRGSDTFAVASDMLVTVAVVAGIMPAKNDKIIIDGVEYKIIEDVSSPAAGTRVVWKFLVRK